MGSAVKLVSTSSILLGQSLSLSDTVQRKQYQANLLGMPYFVFTDVSQIIAFGMILEDSYET